MKILIAEDEPDILIVYKHALKDRGHEVIISENGEKCLKIYKQKLFEQNQQKNMAKNNQTTLTTTSLPSSAARTDQDSLYASPQAPFDVVVLDYKMPEKNGLEVAEEILKLVTRQRIIFASAYVKETLETSVKRLNQVVELLQKPFTVGLLIETIEDREPYEAIKNLMIDIRQHSKDLKNLSPETFGYIFDNVRRIQKGRILE